MAHDRDKQFEELYQYYPAVVSLLRELGFDLDDARDLAQQVFVRVYEHMESYRGESRWSYLQKVTRRLAYNEIRDRHAIKRKGIHIATEEILELDDDRTLPPDTAFELRENADRLYRSVRQLPMGDQALVLMQLAGESHEGISSVTGLKISAVKSRFHVIRKRLRELLGEDVEGLGGDHDH